MNEFERLNDAELDTRISAMHRAWTVAVDAGDPALTATIQVLDTRLIAAHSERAHRHIFNQSPTHTS